MIKLPNGLSERGTDKPGAIQAGATNLTLFSGLVAAVGAGATVFNDTVTKIFGRDADESTIAAVLIALFAGWVLIVVADLSARARTAIPSKTMQSLVECLNTANGKALLQQLERVVASHQQWHVATAPSGLTATVTDGLDVDGFVVAAVRYHESDADRVEYLLVKDGAAPRWYPGESIALTAQGNGKRQTSTRR